MSRPSWIHGLGIPEEHAVRERYQHITNEHTVRGMFMIATVDYLRRQKGDAAADAAARDAGFGDMPWKTMGKVPLKDYNTLRDKVARALMPEVETYEEAIAGIASAAVDTFFDSVAGRTMTLLAGKDPHRLMRAAPNGYSLAISDGAERQYEKLGERSGLFTFVGDRLGPCHQVGVFASAVKIVCDQTLEFRIEQTDLLNFKFHTSW